MNPSKSGEEGRPFFPDHFHQHHHPSHYHHFHHPHNIMDPDDHLESSYQDPHSFTLLLRDTDDDNDSPSHSEDDPDDSAPAATAGTSSIAVCPNSSTPLVDSAPNGLLSPQNAPIDAENISHPGHIDPEPYISSQFYTFNSESHALMIRCLLDGRLATPAEIRAVTLPEVLKSWRAVWKDRNEDTAYTTAWKRIQDKLQAHIDDDNGNQFLCFKNNSQQFVSHFNQWQDIVMRFHGESDLKHLGLKETIERIKQVWTVGAKFYGIPESFIRVCIAACPVCSGPVDGNAAGGYHAGTGRPKRRRFEYTESFDVPAKEVPNKLQQLAKKHKVVLCIRQKYIRYKPFMAEVKDYACHRAGEPASKKSKVLKREPYASKRCGCGFRIRAIVPIANYNEKDKTFVYQEEGMAVFKLYAVHTGHEPGPLDGNARIMHRVVGQSGLLLDQEDEYGVNEEMEFPTAGREEGDFHLPVLQQVQELKNQVALLEGKITKIPRRLLESVSQELYDIVNKVRTLGDEAAKPDELLSTKPHSDVMLVGDTDLSHWPHPNSARLYSEGKEMDLIDDDDDCFGRTLGGVVPWHQMRTEPRCHKDLIAETCKPEKWLNSGDFDEKSILDSGGPKLSRLIRHDDDCIGTDVGLDGIQVDNFYPEHPKWYDSPCVLDSSTDCGDSGFQHGEIA